MFCKNCGTELNENAKFCNGCGAAIGDDGETAQPVEAIPTASTAKKHTLRNVLIAVAVIVAAVLIFRNPGNSSDLTDLASSTSLSNFVNSSNSSSVYASESYNSSTSLPYEEEIVVGTWYLYATVSGDNNTSYLSRSDGSLYLYDDHTGSIYFGGELFDSFIWYYDMYIEELGGSYCYRLYLSDGGALAGVYDFTRFAVSALGGDTLIVFER